MQVFNDFGNTDQLDLKRVLNLKFVTEAEREDYEE